MDERRPSDAPDETEELSSVEVMETICSYLCSVKKEGNSGKPIADWLNRGSRDPRRHLLICEQFTADVRDVLNRLKARSWINLFIKRIDEEWADGGPISEELTKVGGNLASEGNPFQSSLSEGPADVRDLIMKVREKSENEQRVVLTGALLNCFTRSVQDENAGMDIAGVAGSDAARAFKALALFDVEAKLDATTAKLQQPLAEPTQDKLVKMFNPSSQSQSPGCMTREMFVRIFHQYPALVPEVDAESARQAHTNLVDRLKNMSLRFQELCADFALMGAFAHQLAPIVCAYPSAPHRSGVRLLLAKLVDYGNLAMRCEESAALLLSPRPVYGSVDRERERRDLGTETDQDPASPSRQLHRIATETKKFWGDVLQPGSKAYEALYLIRREVEQLDQHEESALEIAERLLGVIDRLDDFIAEPNSTEVDISSVHRVRALLLSFLREHAQIEEYRINPGDSSRDHLKRCQPRDVRGTSRISAVVRPGYWRLNQEPMLRKPLVDLA